MRKTGAELLTASHRAIVSVGVEATREAAELMTQWMLILKIGTLDDPSVFEGPQMAIFTCDAQDYHEVPTGIPTFEKVPG